jgi:hypothetical protein
MRSVTTSCVRSTAKDGNEHHAAAFGASFSSPWPESRGACRGAFKTVAAAIGRFTDDIVEALRGFGIGLQQLVVGADVAGEEDARRRLALLLHFHLDRGRAQKMAGVPESHADARRPARTMFPWPASRTGSAPPWRHPWCTSARPRFAALGVALVQLLHFHFLDEARVRQHDAAKVAVPSLACNQIRQSRASPAWE